jgi:catechol 2,3-dioxygenase-like lactoylglutathione lyase family enzyme
VRFLEVRLDAAEASGEQLTNFYGDRLGLPEVTDRWHAFRAGLTTIDFSPVRDTEPFYHFALRVPRNRFIAARDWLAAHVRLLPDQESGETTFEFANWNAVACYAHDPCGNIVELIAHRELPEETIDGQPFTAGELLGVCEVGVVGPDVRAMAQALEPLGIQLWDGTIDEPRRLAFMGGRDGVLILSPTGRGWIPTGRPAEVRRVETVVAGDRDAEVELPGTPHRVSTIATAARLASSPHAS